MTVSNINTSLMKFLFYWMLNFVFSDHCPFCLLVFGILMPLLCQIALTLSCI